MNASSFVSPPQLLALARELELPSCVCEQLVQTAVPALLDACAPPLCVDKHIPRCVRNDAGSNGAADVVDFCIHRGQLIQQAQLFGARCCRFSR